jgi:hypothetical protein
MPGTMPAEAPLPLFTRVGRDGRLNSLSARSGIRVSIRGFRERPDCTALHCIKMTQKSPLLYPFSKFKLRVYTVHVYTVVVTVQRTD